MEWDNTQCGATTRTRLAGRRGRFRIRRSGPAPSQVPLTRLVTPLTSMAHPLRPDVDIACHGCLGCAPCHPLDKVVTVEKLVLGQSLRRGDPPAPTLNRLLHATSTGPGPSPRDAALRCTLPTASSLTDRATSPHLCHVEPRPFVAADATLPCAPRAHDLEILARQRVSALAMRLPGVLVAHACDPFTSRPWIPVADAPSAPLLPGRAAPGRGASPVAGRRRFDLRRAGQGPHSCPYPS